MSGHAGRIRWLAALLGACAVDPRAAGPRPPAAAAPERRADVVIEDVLRRNEAALMALPGVVGVGLGERDGRGVILIFLDRDPGTLTREAAGRYPAALEGHPVELRRAVNVGP